jgi:tetratricopeptide (TPR) repeat protein
MHAVGSIVIAALLCAVPGPAAGQTQRDPHINTADREKALFHHRLGWQFLGSEAWGNARDEFLKALELVPRMASAQYGLGKAYMGLKEYPSAVQAFSDCRDAYQYHAGRELAAQLPLNQQRQEQVRELRDAIRVQQSGSAASQASRSRVVQELEEQIRVLEQSIGRGSTISPEIEVPAEVYLSLGSAHFRSNKWADAEREYRNAVKAKPNFGEAHNNLAVVFLLTGRYDQAEISVKAAEKAGFRVNPQLKEDIRTARGR